MKSNNDRLNLNKITLLSSFLAILVVSKIALGFAPGFEIVTYLFVIIGLYITTRELLSLSFSFWLLTNIIYGFNIVFIPYLWIFFLIGYSSNKSYSLLKSKYIWGSIMMISPIVLTISYFFYDWALFDYAYASTRVLTAFPTFLLSSISTGFMLIVATPYLLRLFNRYLDKKYDIEFKTGGKQIPLITISFTLSILAIWGTYKIQDNIYSKISDDNTQKYEVLCEGDNPSYKQTSERMMEFEEFCSTLNEMEDDEIMIRFLINEEQLDDATPPMGEMTEFKINIKNAITDKEDTYLSDILWDINDGNDEWGFHFVESATYGTSLRNFSYQGVWYGENNWCGFSFINHTRSVTGVSGIKLKEKAIYTFDYHAFESPFGYCRY